MPKNINGLKGRGGGAGKSIGCKGGGVIKRILSIFYIDGICDSRELKNTIENVTQIVNSRFSNVLQLF